MRQHTVLSPTHLEQLLGLALPEAVGLVLAVDRELCKNRGGRTAAVSYDSLLPPCGERRGPAAPSWYLSICVTTHHDERTHSLTLQLAIIWFEIFMKSLVMRSVVLK